ncbi:MAG TPA: metallophosphoesterase family protein [Phycisphaerae bacterium]|nr:metallophosphoesterase family protein [Phycisphaerae bacterium]
MNVALIGDVHANLPALEAVLADLRRRGAEAVWNVGDFVGYGAEPEEAVCLLRSQCAVSIVGNYDRKVLDFPRKRRKWRKTKTPEKFQAFRWAWERLSEDSRAYLASLPREARLELDGWSVLLVHGSPASPAEHLTDATPQERLEELAGIARADVVVCGHAHVPFCREAAGTRFVGTGSVGRPEGGDPRACYALLSAGPEGVSVDPCRVEYDVEREAAAIRRAGLPEEFAEMLRRAANYDQVKADPGADPGPTDGHRREALAAVRAIWDRCSVEVEHTRQVTKLALRLFDGLVELHGLGPRERFWLECGALLHDIGWIDGQRGHHKTALRLLLRDRQLPFDDRVRRIVASIARYHRKALPAEGHAHFAALDEADRRTVCLLAGILRVADGLDRTHTDAVTDVRCDLSPGRLVIRCMTDGPTDAELWAAEKKSDLLELATGRAVAFEMTCRD